MGNYQTINYTPADSGLGDTLYITGQKINTNFTESNARVSLNSGNPEGVVTGTVGSMCEDTVNGKLYIKESGSGNTGWSLIEDKAYIDSAIASLNLPLNGYVNGFTISNNGSDTAHDIDISTGICVDGMNSVVIKLSSVLTKQLDQTWVAGINQGGMATGESLPTSGTIHIWAISKVDGTTDVMANNHATTALNPTLPAGYVYKRRIGSLMTDSSANIRAFVQVGDYFNYYFGSVTTGITDLSTTSIVAKTNLTLSVPTGLKIRPIISVFNYSDASYAIECAVYDINTNLKYDVNVSAAYDKVNYVYTQLFTNTSSQIAYSTGNGGYAPLGFTIKTFGWIDTRGME